MKSPFPAGSFHHVLRMACAAILVVSAPLTATAQLTWDANTGTSGLQNGSGTWNTSLANWLNGLGENVAWTNSATAIADIGGGTATTTGTSTALITITVASDIMLDTLNFRGFTTAPTSYNMYTLQGDVAGRVLDFGTDGLIQMEDRSSGGSQFVTLSSNLRLRSNNLTIQKYVAGSTAFQYISLAMGANPELTGTLTIGGSIYATISGPNTMQAVDRLTVLAGGSAALSGAGTVYTQAMSLAGIGNSLAFSGTAYGAIRLVSNNITLAGPITLTADSGIHTNFSGASSYSGVISGSIGDDGKNFSFNRFTFTRGGDSVITMTGTNTYGGATILGRNVASYSGGITVLDFSAASAPLSDILYNGLTTPGNLVMASGNSATTLRLVGRSEQASTQRFKDLSISGAYNVLELVSGAGGSMDVSFGNFSRVEQTATLSVLAPFSGAISTTQTAGFAGPWMSFTSAYGARSWGQVAGGVITGGYAGDTPFETGQNLGATPFSATSNARITSGTTGNVTAGAGTTNLNTLSSTDIIADRVVELAASQTLRLGVQGGIQIVNGAQDLTIGNAGVASTLSAGGSVTNTAGVLFLTNHSSTGTLLINSTIANNGTTGLVTVVANGAPGTRTVLANTASHTGGTQISSGILELRHGGALGTTGTVTVLEGATLALSGGITVTRALTAVGGFGDGGNGAIRSLSGTNTISGTITQTAPALLAADAGATLNVGAINGSFFLTFGGAGNVNANGIIGAVSGLTKTGLGTLTLNGANTYAGGITLSMGTLKFGTATTLPVQTITGAAGSVIDLNGFSVANGVSLAGAGNGSGALISSGGAGTITGTAALNAATLVNLSNNITINNAGGLTGNVLLTKTGSGTFTIISTAASARTGSTQVDAGTLRVQSAAAVTPLGTGAYSLNGGTLSLGFDLTNALTNVVNLISSSTIITDRASSGAGGNVTTLSTLTIGGSTLTVKAGDSVTSGTIGLTTASVSIGGVSMRPGNPTFDVQSTAAAATTLTLGALSDQAIAARTITFQNSGTAASTATLATAASSLVDGTQVNIASGSGAVTLNLNVANALGTLSQVTVGSGNTLSIGAAQTIASLAGSGTVSATGTFTLTVGNALSATLLDSTFSGVLANGTGTLALTKSGRGTLTLDGASSNTYTGATIVNGGTLVLAKTDGATAIGSVASGAAITIGALAASTQGNATVRLEADNQMVISASDTNNLTINAGGTLDTNGHILTVNTLASFFGSTVTGSGTLAMNRTSGTIAFAGINTISSTFQITTATSGSATRTVQVTGVMDQLTISGPITQVVSAGGFNKTFSGTLIFAGNNSYTAGTTVTSGVLNIRHNNALGTTANGTVVASGGTLQIQGGITTPEESLTLSGTGFAGASGINYQTGAFVNVTDTNNYAGLITLGAAATISSNSGTLNLTHTGTITGATFALTLAGAGDGSIASIIGTTTGGVVKNGAGTWTLSGVNTGTGAITITAGTLKLGDGTTGRYSSTPGLTYTGTGIFEFGGSTAASTQALGVLTLTSGAGTLQVDAPATGTNTVTFTSMAAPAAGSSLNIISGAGTSVTITGTSSVNGIVNARLYYNGADFAASTAGVIGAASTTPAGSSLADSNALPYLITGSFPQTASVTVNAGVKFSGNHTLTLNNSILLTLNNGTNTAGGLLVAGGSTAIIANEGSATGITTGGSGDLVIRTDTAADSLNIQVPINSTTTGGLTKNGAGTLRLSAANAYTGPTNINEGTVILSNSAALSTSATTVRVRGVLDLNGQTIGNAVTLNGTGISNAGALINSSPTPAFFGALTIDTGFGSGGIGASIGGTGNITTTGALAGNNLLVKTGSGTFTVGTNGTTAVPSTRTGNTRIDEGVLRISNSTTGLGAATAQVILNGGTLSLGTSASVVAYPTAVSASSGIITDVFTAGAGLTHTLGTLIIGSHTLTISAGSNVTTAATNAGVTFGATTLMGNATFDVQSPTTATGGTTTLTLGALNDLGVARTISFTNTGTSTTSSVVTLGTAMASLTEGTQVNLTGRVTLNLNAAAGLGTLAQVSLGTNSVLNVGAAATIASLTGSGTVSANAAAFTLTVGTANSAVFDTTFTGSLINGSGTLALTKNGLGTLTLAPSVSTYTGLTTVSAGALKLGNSTALGTTSSVTISAGGTVDLNGQTTNRNFGSINGVGHAGGGALINSSTTTPATITGTAVLAGAARIGGAGDITISNTGGLTGNVLLTKFGSSTLTVISTATSARSGTNQIDEGTLRIQALTGIAPVGTGVMVLNGGTLSLGFNASGTVGGAVNVLADSTIIADRATSDVGSSTLTMGAVIIGGSKLTVKAGDNVTGGTVGLTLTTVTLGGPSLAPGNPVFDVQGSSAATTTLTLGALSDQAIAPRILTFQNSGTGASTITLSAAATSLVDGTVVNLASTGSALTLNLNNATSIGTMSQVTVATGNTLVLGASQTINALNGGGSVNATGNAVLTIGNTSSPTTVNSTFDGDFSGAGLSVVKAGNGTLTLGGMNNNTFAGAGGLAVNSGTLVLAKTGAATAVPARLTIGTVGAVSGSATVRLAGEDQIATSATVTMNAQSFLDLNGFTAALGTVVGTPGGTIMNNATGTSALLTVGAMDATGQHLGAIVDSTSGTGGTLAFAKTGSGAFTLGGYNTYSGGTQVQGGSLQVGIIGMGTTGTGDVVLHGGTTLLGTGTIRGSSFYAVSGSTIHAGDGTAQANYGTLTFKPADGSGTFDLQAGSTIVLGINPGGVSDLLAFTGTGTNTLQFNSSLTVTAAAGFVPTGQVTFDLLDWAGLASEPTFASRYAHTGTLYGNGDEAAGLDLPDLFGTGYGWDISNFMLNGSISIVFVPEPSRALLLGLALGVLGMRRRRK